MNQNTEKKKIVLPGILNFTIGIMLLSFGMAVMLAVKLGMSPTASLPVTIYEAVNFLTAGRWITIIQILFIIGAMIVSGKIKMSHILSFVTVVILGLLIDLFDFLIAPIVPNGLIIQIIIILVSCVIMSVGVSFLLLSKYPPMPDLFFMNEMHIKHKISVGKTKMIIDIISVSIAAILSYFVLNAFIHVGIGTVISALVLGFLIHKIKPVVYSRFSNSISKSGNKLLSVLDYNLIDRFTK
jgi:uncharacterized membrane protein YczE